MATSNYGKSIVGGLPKTARFDVTADNDELLPDGNYIVLAAYFNDTVTALNISGGADIVDYPFTTDAASVHATTGGAGSVTVVYCELPANRYESYDT